MMAKEEPSWQPTHVLSFKGMKITVMVDDDTGDAHTAEEWAECDSARWHRSPDGFWTFEGRFPERLKVVRLNA